MRSVIACALVATFFLSSAIIVPVLVRRLILPQRKKKILVAVIIFSVFAKLAVTQLSIATMPNSMGDYTTWKTVAELMAEHKSVYAESGGHYCVVRDRGCYQFAPVWAWIVFGLDRLSSLLYGESMGAFRLALSAFLATTDVLIGLVLVYRYSYTAALLFLLAPLSVWLEISEGNFNNLALLVALLAWLMIRKKEPTSQAVFLSGVLTGLSLIIKHILALFPLWLLLYKNLKLRDRLVYAVVAYGIFFCSFLPWWDDPISRVGIIERVFRYNSDYGFSLIGRITQHLVPISTLDASLRLPLLSPFKLYWLILLMAIGALATQRNLKELLLCYLLALYGFSISLFDEYLVIPMLVCCIFYKSWASWGFMLFSTVIMIVAQPFPIPFIPLPWEDFLYPRLVFAGQACIIALLVLRWRDASAESEQINIPLLPHKR